jgi:hypothetical protein
MSIGIETVPADDAVSSGVDRMTDRKPFRDDLGSCYVIRSGIGKTHRMTMRKVIPAVSQSQ